MNSKRIAKKIISEIAPILHYVPGWEKLVIKKCQVGKAVKKTDLLGRLVHSFFWQEYYKRLPAKRIDIQSKLMGQESGADWAKHYDQERESFPPKEGEAKVGNLDWHQACPYVKQITQLISPDQKSFFVIQLGASSGKEISYFAKIFPDTDCLYTDIFESVTSYAKKILSLPNLNYVTCPTESLAALAQTSKKPRVLIFSSGSSQYVYPEQLDYMFRLLSKIEDKSIDFICCEPGNNSEINPKNIKGSMPRGGFSYTHNYQFYAEKNGFKTKRFDIIEPYKPKEDFYPLHQGTVHLNGWFSYFKSN